MRLYQRSQAKRGSGIDSRAVPGERNVYFVLLLGVNFALMLGFVSSFAQIARLLADLRYRKNALPGREIFHEHFLSDPRSMAQKSLVSAGAKKIQGISEGLSADQMLEVRSLLCGQIKLSFHLQHHPAPCKLFQAEAAARLQAPLW